MESINSRKFSRCLGFGNFRIPFGFLLNSEEKNKAFLVFDFPD